MITWKDTIEIIKRTFSIEQIEIANCLNITESQLSKVKTGKSKTVPSNFASSHVFRKIFDPSNEDSPASGKETPEYHLDVLKSIIQTEFAQVREDLSDFWNEKDYKTFVIGLLDRTNLAKPPKDRTAQLASKKQPLLGDLRCNTSKDVFDFFNQAVLDYRIKLFVESVDPSSIMDIDYIEKCSKFIEVIKSDSWIPCTADAIAETKSIVQKVYLFADVLNEYILYLGKNMHPADQVQAPTVFVPLYRDEDVKWALDFGGRVQNYRQKLVSIYLEICNNIFDE